MSFPGYADYRDAEAEWLPRLPTHWRLASLRWLSRRFSGGTPDKNSPEYWENGTIPWLNSGEVNQGLITAPSTFISDAGFANSSAKWIPAGALVMALAGQGKTKGMVAQLAFPATCNQSMAAIVPSAEVNARFLYWWLQSNYQNIRNMAGGDLRDGLNLDLLGEIPCPLPSSAEQSGIAAFLDRETAKIDALVEEQKRLIELLKEKRQAVISQAVTKGLDPSVPLKDSGVAWLGEVPAQWGTWKVRHGFECVGSGTTPPSDEVQWYGGTTPWVTTGELRETVITESVKSVSREALSKFSALKVYPMGSLVVAMYGATIGRLGILGTPATTNQACCALSGERGLTVKFTYYWLMAFKDQVIALYATGGGQPNISQEVIASLRVPAPGLPEQKRIAEFLDREVSQFAALISEAEQVVDLLQERRSALISAAVTGKIDVRGLVPQPEVIAA